MGKTNADHGTKTHSLCIRIAHRMPTAQSGLYVDFGFRFPDISSAFGGHRKVLTSSVIHSQYPNRFRGNNQPTSGRVPEHNSKACSKPEQQDRKQDMLKISKD